MAQPTSRDHALNNLASTLYVDAFHFHHNVKTAFDKNINYIDILLFIYNIKEIYIDMLRPVSTVDP